ncbi:ankyrin, partial [Lindgomyces ingoldianus]
DIEAKDNAKRTALHWAAENGHKRVVQLLVERGAHTAEKDYIGRTPLRIAAENGHKAIVRLLIDKMAEIRAKHGTG